MGLKDTLKLIQGVADKYLIDKPYLVGGLPRDIYMSIPNVKTTDIDLTTNSAEVLRLGILLANEMNVTFELSDDGHITVFADEFDIDFSSHFVSPEVVKYLAGKNKKFEEAFSRDFTINTLHQDLVSEEIIDPTGQGFEDIKNKLIRTPVPAEITLIDDPRRAYRAINLAARYNFNIDDEIKNFVIDNPGIFTADKVKDKYIAVKINKALGTNEALTLKLLKEMNLFQQVPLSGYFKEVLIRNKLLVDYLGSSELNKKIAFDVSDWDSYVAQGPAYKTLADWWHQNASKLSKTPAFQDWTSWYMNKYHSEWNGNHRGPEEVLKIMKSESNPSWGISDLFRGFKSRKKELYDLLGDTRDEKALPKQEESYRMDSNGKVYLKPGVDVENVIPAVKAFIKDLGEVSESLGMPTPTITSGWRSPESQAKIMGQNWLNNGGRNGGRKYLAGLYGREYGNQMSDVFENLGIGNEAMGPAIQVIQSRPIGSSHILTPGQAIDVRPTSGIKKVLNTIQAMGKYDMKIVDETNTAGPHYHITIRGLNSKIAVIQNRKEIIKSFK